MSFASTRNPWLTVAVVFAGGLCTFATSTLQRVRPPTFADLAVSLGQPWRGRPRMPIGAALETAGAVPTDAELLAAAGALHAPLPIPAAAPLPAVDGGIPAPAATPTVPAATAVPAAAAATHARGSAFLTDPDDELRHFHAALARAARKQGIVRVAHFGDSVVTSDLITGEARWLLHLMVGDAGHGWVLPGRPWESYNHVGVTTEGTGWRVNAPELTWRGDARYGLAGVSFTGIGAESRIRVGKTIAFTHIEVHFLAGPRGGSLMVSVDRAPPVEVSTRADEIHAAMQRIEVGEGHHDIHLRTKGNGEVTLYGVALERDVPGGAVYDALGSNGSMMDLRVKGDATNFVEALKLRRPDLVVLAFGTNESQAPKLSSGYARSYEEMVRRIREALPETSILIMSPLDRGERGKDTSLPVLQRIVEAQRRFAQQAHVAFFDSVAAMGGPGSAARWYRAAPRLMAGDMTHPTRAGADRVARLLTAALTAGRHPVPPAPAGQEEAADAGH